MKTGHHSRCQIIHDFFGLLCDEEIEASAVLVESSRHHSLWTHWVNFYPAFNSILNFFMI